MASWISAAVFLLVAVNSIQQCNCYLYPTNGALGSLPSNCLTTLNNIFNDYYLLTSTTTSEDNRTDAWFLNAQRRLGCRLSILEALEPTAATTCPPEDQLINCFWVAGKEWASMVQSCELFQSQVPLPVCSDIVGEAAEGIPSCSSIADSTSIQGRRRLLQGGPANNVGIAEWAVSDGEAAGLQYDPYAPVGSPYAQPPLSGAQQGATGIDAAALSAESEGNEGGAISGGTSGAASTASGCFPSFWDPQDFDQWLNGDFTETARPMDYGSLNAVGMVSVCIYTIALASLAFF